MYNPNVPCDQGVLELCPAITTIEERTRSSISGVVTCDLSQDDLFPNVTGLLADVVICSLVFDVVATDTAMLEQAMKRTAR